MRPRWPMSCARPAFPSRSNTPSRSCSDGRTVGAYAADLLVEQALLVELKATKALDPAHRAQCFNYLKATRLPLCLLLNFGNPSLEIKRIVDRL